MKLTTCCYLVSKLRKSAAEPFCLTYIQGVQKDNVKYMFKQRYFLGPLAVTVSEFNANWKVPKNLSKIIMLQCSWKSTQTLLNANRRKDMVQFIAAQLYLFTECLLQHMVQFIAAQLYLFTECLLQHMVQFIAAQLYLFTE